MSQAIAKELTAGPPAGAANGAALAVMLGGIGVGLVLVAVSGLIVVRTLSRPAPVIAQAPVQEPPVTPVQTRPVEPAPPPATPVTVPAAPTPASPPIPSSPPNSLPVAATPIATQPVESPVNSGPMNVTMERGASVDLLAVSDQRRVIGGSFHVLDGKGTTDSAGRTDLVTKLSLPGMYAFEARLKRTAGSGTVQFHLPVEGGLVTLSLDTVRNGKLISGLEQTQGRDPLTGPAFRAQSAPLVPVSSVLDLKVFVLDRTISAQVNGQSLIRYTGALKSLAADHPPSPTELAITTQDAGIEFTHLRVINLERYTNIQGTNSSTRGRIANLDLDLGSSTDVLQQPPKPLGGSFTRTGPRLATDPRGNCKLEFPCELSGNYLVELTLARHSGTDSLSTFLRVGGRECAFVLDGFSNLGGASGFDTIGGERVLQRQATVKGLQLTDGRAARLRLAVVNSRLLAELNGRLIDDWNGDPALLAIDPTLSFGTSGRLRLITWFSGYEITALRYTPIAASRIIQGPPGAAPLIAATPAAGTPPAPMPVEPAVAASPLSRAPVPAESAQQPIRDNLAKVFGDQLAKAKKAEEKAQLAREMADVTKNEPDAATRFVLLTAARKLAISGLDYKLAVELAEKTAAQFEVDPIGLRLETLTQGAATAGSFTESQKSLAALAADLAEETLASQRYDVAESASKLAADSGIKSKDAESRRTTKELRDEVVAEKKLWDAMQAALDKLKTTPTDAASHLIVGKYYGLAREDWSKALSHLSASGDTALAPAAAAEEQAKDGVGQLSAAEKWQAAATAAKGIERLALARHALALCDAAAPQLAGLPKVRAEKCQAELQVLIGEAEKAAPASGLSKLSRMRSGRLEPGVVVRTFRGDLSRPSTAISIVLSSDEYAQNLESVKNVVGRGYPNSYFIPTAEGYIVMDQPGTVEFELANCTCLVNGAKFVEHTQPTPTTIERQLNKGRYAVVFVPSNDRFTSPEFKVTLKGGTKNVLFHSQQDLQNALGQVVYINGAPGVGVLVYRTPAE